jgi:hypothetical protein
MASAHTKKPAATMKLACNVVTLLANIILEQVDML